LRRLMSLGGMVVGHLGMLGCVGLIALFMGFCGVSMRSGGFIVMSCGFVVIVFRHFVSGNG
jgi:hypothetical protein